MEPRKGVAKRVGAVLLTTFTLMILGIIAFVTIAALLSWLTGRDESSNSELMFVMRDAMIGAVFGGCMLTYGNPRLIFTPYQWLISKFIDVIRLRNIRTRVQKIMFLVFCLGVLTAGSDYIIFKFNYSWIRFTRAFGFLAAEFPGYIRIFWIGVILIIIGLIGSFFYDISLGYIVRWVVADNRGKARVGRE